MRRRWAFKTFLVLLPFVLFLSPYAFGGEIKLRWNPPTAKVNGSRLVSPTPSNKSAYSKEVIGGEFAVVVYPMTLEVVVDSVTYTGFQYFSWEEGSSHSLSVTSPQPGEDEGTRYVYDYWDDGGDQSHSIIASSTVPVYFAVFKPQVSLTTDVNPVGAGMINPSGTNWYDAGQNVTLSATANAGYTFDGWSGDASETTGSIEITMDAKKTVIANFRAAGGGGGSPPIPPSVAYTVTTSPSGLQITVDEETYTAPHAFNWSSGTIHTVSISSPQSGVPGTQYVFSSWSDGGAQEHWILAPSIATTFTANFTTQRISSGPNPVKVIIEPDSVDFGIEEKGKMVELGVKISNIGGMTLNIKSLEITPNDNSEFFVSSDCAAVSVGSFCNSVVGFAPVSTGAKAATLVVSLNDSASTAINVALSGVASDTAPASISVSPEEIHIPYVDLEMGDTRSIRINNGGTGSLIINFVTVAGPDASEFSVDSKCTVIAPNSNCDLSLSGKYTSQKEKRVSVVIVSNASNSPRLEIPVTVSSARCNEVDGDIILSTTSRTVSSEAQNGTVNVTWTGSGSCVLDAVSRSSWITVSYNANSVTYSVTVNTSGAERRGSISIGGRPFTIIQSSGPSDTIFNDSPDNGFDDYINAIYAEGITRGCGQQGSTAFFCPTDFVTRGEMGAFIIRAMYGEAFIYPQTPYFSDVPSSHPFFDYVQKLKNTGITAVSDVYGVDEYVTRGQVAAFIIRSIYGEAFGYTQSSYFIDVPDTHIFFKYVQKVKDTGITALSGTYRVDDYVTRGEMAAFIGRAFLGMK